MAPELRQNSVSFWGQPNLSVELGMFFIIVLNGSQTKRRLCSYEAKHLGKAEDAEPHRITALKRVVDAVRNFEDSKNNRALERVYKWPRGGRLVDGSSPGSAVGNEIAGTGRPRPFSKAKTELLLSPSGGL